MSIEPGGINSRDFWEEKGFVVKAKGKGKNEKFYVRTNAQKELKTKNIFKKIMNARAVDEANKAARQEIANVLYAEAVTGVNLEDENSHQFVDDGKQDFNKSLALKVWKEAKVFKGVKWSLGQKLSTKKLGKINQVFTEKLIHSGRGMMPESSQIYGEGDKRSNDLRTTVFRHNELVSHLLGWEDDFGAILGNSQLMKDIQIESSEDFLRSGKEALNMVLQNSVKIFNENVSENGFDENKRALFEGFVQQSLSLIPYFGPVEGDVFTVPVYNPETNTYDNIDYEVNKIIELSPPALGTPLIAAGMVPKNNNQDAPPPIISFSGTPLPGGSGYGAGLLSDMTPFMSPGHAASIYAKDTMREWLQTYTNNGHKPATLTGASLGGGLCLHTLRFHKKYVGEIHAFNPAGLHPWDTWGKSADATYRSGSKTRDVKVRVYSQENDVVSSMGYYPRGKDVKVYRIFGEKPENLLYAHARAYMGSKKVVVIESDNDFEAARVDRIGWTVLHLLISPVLFVPALAITLLGVGGKTVFNFCKPLFSKKKSKEDNVEEVDKDKNKKVSDPIEENSDNSEMSNSNLHTQSDTPSYRMANPDKSDIFEDDELEIDWYNVEIENDNDKSTKN